MSQHPRWPPLPPLVHDLRSIPFTEHDEEQPPLRPWDLTALTGELEHAVWQWLDEVACWLNHTYGHRDDQIIPGCWPDHPGIALDLAGLAFNRIDIYNSATAAYVTRWHADLEDFHRRMTTALGLNSPCHQGHHDELPERHTTATANAAIRSRMRPRPGGPAP